MTEVPSLFAHPWALSLLLAMPLLALVQFIAAWRGRRKLLRLGQPIALAGLLPPAPRFRWLSAFLFSTAVTALVAAAAGPRWGRDPRPQVVAGRDLIVLLDMSNSMRATDTVPDRFRRGIAAAKELIDYVRSRGGHRLGLVVFAADAQVVCPLTHDYDHFQLKLEGLDLDHPPPGLRPKPGTKSGTRLGAGLRGAIAAHDADVRGFQDVLLLSDGHDPLGNEEWEAGLKQIENSGVPFFTVGIGDPASDRDLLLPAAGETVRTRLHEYPLKEIAKRTGGFYLAAHREAPRLTEFFRQRIESKGAATPRGEPPPLPQSRQVWFYAAALALFGLAGLIQLRCSDLAVFRLQRARSEKGPVVNRRVQRVAIAVLILWTLLAAAPVMPEEWERRGNAAFVDGRFDEAAQYYAQAEERSDRPGRLAFNSAVSHFNLGRYREAERLFRAALESGDTARRDRARYNLGTCLLHSSEGRDANRLGEAIQQFERCLDMAGADPSVLIDARHNLELAKQLWRKIRADAPPPESDPNAKDGSTDQDPPDRPMDGHENMGSDSADPMGRPGAVPVNGGTEGPKPIPTDQNPGPGHGSMSPISDREQLNPLQPHEARELLRQAADRIARERKALQRAGGTEMRSYPDW